MTEEQFERLVRRLEGQSAVDPSGYRARLSALMVLGFAFPLLAIAGILALAGVLALLLHGFVFVLLKVAWIALFPLYVGVRSLFVRLPEPEGVRLSAGEAPGLRALAERIRCDLAVAPLHGIVINGAVNAAVVQRPRFGLVGSAQNYLIIGLPLLEALSAEQFEAVLAHEFGHLSRKHGAFSARVYSARMGLGNLAVALDQRGRWLVRFLRPFYRWYVPYLDAYSFVLARRVEAEADRLAAARTSAVALCSALVAIALQSRRLDRGFWPAIDDRQTADGLPPSTLFEEMGRFLAVPFAHAEQSVRSALLRKTEYDDTHPALFERLRALGVDVSDVARSLASAGGATAAEVFLESDRAQIQKDLNAWWAARVVQAWQRRDQERRKLHAELEKLDELAAQGTVTDAQASDRATLATRLRRADASGLLRAILDRDPGNAAAHFHLGVLLLEEHDDPSGLEHLEQAMRADSDAVIPAANTAYAFCMERGETERAFAYRQRYIEAARAAEAATASGAAAAST